MDQRKFLKYVLLSGVFLSSFGFFVIIPYLPTFLKMAKVEDGLYFWSGLITSASFITSALLGPFWGKMADSYGSRLMLMRSALGLSLVYALIPSCKDPYLLLFVRVLNGMAAGFVPAAMTFLSILTVKEEMGSTMTQVSIAKALGAILGPGLAGLFAPIIGIENVFYVASATMFTCFLLCLIFLKDPDSNDQKTHETVRPSEKIQSKFSFEKPLILALLFSSLAVLGMSLLTPIIPISIEKLFPENVTRAIGLIYSIGGIVTVFTAPFWGKMADRYGFRTIARLMILGGIISLVPMGLVHHQVLFIVLFVTYSVFICELGSMGNVYLVEVSRNDNQGVIFGYAHTFSQIGLSLGPLLGGFIAEKVDGSVVYMIAAFFIFISLFLLRRTNNDS